MANHIGGNLNLAAPEGITVAQLAAPASVDATDVKIKSVAIKGQEGADPNIVVRFELMDVGGVVLRARTITVKGPHAQPLLDALGALGREVLGRLQTDGVLNAGTLSG